MVMLDFVIIGAGAAGLAAARRLMEKGASFRLLEAKPRVGGRVVTDSATLGVPVDLGAHWLHSPALNPLTPLVDRYLFHVKHGAEDFRVSRNGAIVTGAAHRDCFAYVDDCFARIAAFGDAERDCAVSDLFPARGEWHDFFEANFIAKQGVAPAQSSALDFARYVWEGDDWPVLDGFGALIARHAEGIPVELETPATRIAWGGRTGIAVETPRGTLEARAAIIAVSTGVLAEDVIRFTPSLPAWKQQAIADLPLGSCNKVALRAQPVRQARHGHADARPWTGRMGRVRGARGRPRRGDDHDQWPVRQGAGGGGCARHGGLRVDATCGNLRQRCEGVRDGSHRVCGLGP
jgi:monoamine oxidase